MQNVGLTMEYVTSDIMMVTNQKMKYQAQSTWARSAEFGLTLRNGHQELVCQLCILHTEKQHTVTEIIVLHHHIYCKSIPSHRKYNDSNQSLCTSIHLRLMQ